MSSKNKSLFAPAIISPIVSGQLQPRSLRLRLVLWYSVLLTIALIFFAVLVWELTTNALNESIDSSVHAETRIIASALNHELTSNEPYWPEHVTLQSVNVYQDPGTVFEIIDAQGKNRYDSDQNPATSIPISSANVKAVLSGERVWYTANVDNGRVRVEATPLYAPDASVRGQAKHLIGRLLVAKSFSEVDSALLVLRTLLILTGLATVIGTLVGGWAIAARVLYPLAEMVKTARAITATTVRGTRIGNLSQRVRRPGGNDEMAQVVDTFNEMLTGLERATKAQRRFVADASHELRAPLTTIQGNLAFVQRHGDELSQEELHTMLGDAHAETLRLAQLVEELLLLARADANVDKSFGPAAEEPQWVQEVEQKPVELDHTVLQLIRQFRGRLSIEDAKLEVGHIEPVRVLGSEESIRRVLLILLDNALKYTSKSEANKTERVVVSLERRGEEAVLRVRDTGIGIDADDLPHIFERFYRADQARSRQGTGLGLSIAQTLIEHAGGRITAESTPGQGSTFSIWLPLA